MTVREWLDRYEAAFVTHGVPAKMAKEMRTAETFDVLSDGFEDDPEGACDMELSYWTDDGDSAETT